MGVKALVVASICVCVPACGNDGGGARRDGGVIDQIVQDDAPIDAFVFNPSACDPLAAAGTQCPAGQKCSWVDLGSFGATGCVPAGPVALDGACTIGPEGNTGYDNCGEGMYCASGVCRPVCDLNGTSCSCVSIDTVFANPGTAPIAGVCGIDCNPLSQLTTVGGVACPGQQGCYPALNASMTTTMAVCGRAGTVAIGDVISGIVYPNSCVPGGVPRAVQGTAQYECAAMCQPNDVYQNNNVADEGGVAPYTCAAKGAALPDDATAGESCRYWWSREPFSELSPFSNTLGWCFKHAAWTYDSDGDMVNDAPYPRCIDLTTSDVVLPINGASDALYFFCTAQPAAMLRTVAPPRVELSRFDNTARN